MKQQSDENKKIDTKIRESDDYQFLQEKIKERPVNRKKLLKNTLMTLGFAVIFGAVACATFILLEPVLGNLISKGENKTVVVLPPEDDEMLPEDMIWADDELEEDGQSNISNAVSTVELQATDLQVLYDKMCLIANEAQKSMVVVTGRTSDVDWFSTNYERQTRSSGLLVADNGKEYLFLSNYNAVVKASRIFVTFCDGTEVEATLKSYDKSIGKAIVAVEMNAVPKQTKDAISYAKLSSSNVNCEPGRVVMAIGNPMGYQNSLGFGVITSSGNPVSVVDGSYKLITTDIIGSAQASGVLINMSGRVIGIIDQSFMGDELGNQICAIGISELRKKIESLSNVDPIPYLGLKVSDVTKVAQEEFKVPNGAYVTEVMMDSPAMNVGTRKGDVITAINDVIVTSVYDYVSELSSCKPGDEITITVMRQSVEGYKEVNLKVVLSELKD